MCIYGVFQDSRVYCHMHNDYIEQSLAIKCLGHRLSYRKAQNITSRKNIESSNGTEIIVFPTNFNNVKMHFKCEIKIFYLYVV